MRRGDFFALTVVSIRVLRVPGTPQSLRYTAVRQVCKVLARYTAFAGYARCSPGMRPFAGYARCSPGMRPFAGRVGRSTFGSKLLP